MGKKIVLFLLAAGAVFSADIESRIVRVTVYPGMALVEREVNCSLRAGSHELSLTGLPASLLDESVHARLISGEGLTLGDVNVEKWFLAKAEEGEVHKLEAAIQELERQNKLLEGETKSLAAREKFLQSIQATAAVSAGQPVAVIRPDAASWNSTLTFVGTNLNKVYGEMVDIEFKCRELKQEKEALEKQLAEIRSAKPHEDKSVGLTVQAAKPTSAQFAVSYLVTDVNWGPTYEIRALPAEGTMELVYSGQVHQKTGENWTDIELYLSTAQPARGASAPELFPWDLRLWQESRLALQKAARADAMVMAAQMDKASEEMAPPAPAAVESRSTSVLFAIPGRRDIISGEEPAKVLIARNSYTAQMSYITLPKLSSFVYLQGKIVNEGLYPLLSGEGLIYVDGDYVGKTVIKPLASGESVDLSLGVDEGLKVKRELVKKYERNKGTIGKKHEMEYDYRITIENFKKKAVEVKVVDQLPRPLQQEIELGDIRITPEPGEWDKEKQQLSWPLQIKPGEKKEVLLHFSVTYPRGARVFGLD